MDEDYTALENELAQTVANIESTHPGYDEYRYSVDEIGHNPYEPVSYTHLSKPGKRLPNGQRRNGLRRKSPAVGQSVDLGP